MNPELTPHSSRSREPQSFTIKSKKSRRNFYRKKSFSSFVITQTDYDLVYYSDRASFVGVAVGYA